MIIILLAITSLLSACSNPKKNSTENSRGTIGVVTPEQPKPAQADIIIRDDQSETAQNTTLNTAPETAPADLIERIRRGFQFSDIDSKYTQDYIKWSVNHPTYLSNLFARAEPFLYYILEEIEKRGLPTELALIPAIESAYKPNAISSSNAGGLWQFIPSTGRDFGLTQDWWFDGRRDLIKSTHAALDYFSQLNTLFDGDWHLTLAAYNAGQGTILRAIKANASKGKDTHYQSLSLREETIKYVPKLQALKEIIKHTSRYDVALAKMANQPYFEVVTLPGQIDLHDFVEKATLDLALVQHMNAGHLRWATSPNGPHRLLLPLANHQQSSVALQNITANPNIDYHRHSIQSGETLSQISAQYGVSVNAIQTANDLNNSKIRAGNSLMIPVASSAVALASQKPSSAETKLIHRVVKGDTLWSISKRYNVALNQLLSWNQLNSNQILKLNQALLIFAN